MILRYALVGICTYIIYNFLLFWLDSSFSSVIASSFSYFFSMSFNFLAMRYYTFRASSSLPSQQLIKFSILSVFNYFLIVFSNYFFVDIFGFNIFYVNNAALFVSILIGFSVNNFLIFKTNIRF